MDINALIGPGSSPAILIHACAAILATVLGAVVLFMKKGTRLHKAVGRAWVLTMVVTAGSSFLISELRMFGPYSWIHGLSILTLYLLGQAIWMIRRGNVAGHRSTMVSLYVFSLLIAGGFTLMPGRRMHEMLFADGGQSAAVLAVAIAGIVGAALLVKWQSRTKGRPAPYPSSSRAS